VGSSITSSIRTYKRRAGRVTPTQRQALLRSWPRLGLDAHGDRVDLPRLFGRSAPVVLEIGFGMGDSTAVMAAAEPERDVLAVDVHTPGHGHLMALLVADGLTNVRIVSGDARAVLADMLAPASVQVVRVFFPDPWPKTRHAKRRLMTADVVDLVADRLVDDGVLHIATDVAAYADRVRRVLTSCPALRVSEHVPWRPPTRFEQRARRAGRPAYDLAAARVAR